MPSSHRSFIVIVGLAAFLNAGCDGLFTDDTTSSSPTAPSSGTLDAFIGVWTSVAATSAPATSCADVSYTVTAVTPTSATVTFDAICAGTLEVAGNGVGTLNGSTLDWEAQGSVTQGNITCPFSFDDSSATAEGSGLRVTYSGTICGIGVSGAELLQ